MPKTNLKRYQYGEALLGLAKTFEDQISPVKTKDIIPYFYGENIFFDDAFQIYLKNISK